VLEGFQKVQIVKSGGTFLDYRIEVTRVYTWSKLNYVGVAGSILTLISGFLPWWTISSSTRWAEGTMTMYLYNTEIAGSSAFFGNWENEPLSNVLAFASLVLLVIGSVSAIVGSLRNNKSVLVSGGALGLAAPLGFVVTLQWLWLLTNGIGVYSSGTLPNGVSYSSHLESGFWLSVIGAIIMLAGGFAWKSSTSSDKPRIRPPIPPPP
jgi:hypothetical protein